MCPIRCPVALCCQEQGRRSSCCLEQGWGQPRAVYTTKRLSFLYLPFHWEERLPFLKGLCWHLTSNKLSSLLGISWLWSSLSRYSGGKRNCLCFQTVPLGILPLAYSVHSLREKSRYRNWIFTNRSCLETLQLATRLSSR